MSERLVGILVDSFGKILLPGLTVTIPLTVISCTLALIIAVVVALVQFAHVPVLQQIARFYIWVMRGTPVLVQLFVVFYGLPGVGSLIEPFPAAVLVFSINEGAYCAETVRAALEAVPQGQMEAGQCVVLDFGARSYGYCSDMTRTVAVGYATDEMKHVYDTVLKAQLTAIAATKAGVPGKDIDGTARKVIADAGYGEYFGHGFGFCIGLEIHENPSPNASNTEPLPAGVVCSAEPGIYLPGKFGVRIEDVTIITEDGCEDITGSPKNLIIV